MVVSYNLLSLIFGRSTISWVIPSLFFVNGDDFSSYPISQPADNKIGSRAYIGASRFIKNLNLENWVTFLY